ncbi:MAG: hypothetical protein AAGG09_08425 [Pseudomonadota bacterium]
MGRLLFWIEGRAAPLAYTICAFVVLACWAIVLMEGPVLKSTDEADFLGIARGVVEEGQYAREGALTAYRAPGLVFFLLPVVSFGGDLVAGRMALAVLLGGTLALCFDLVRRNASGAAGVLAVLMIPAWPVVVYSATTLYPQMLAAFLLVLVVWALDRFCRERRTRYAAIGGLGYGLLALTTPVALALSPLLALFVLLRRAWLWKPALVFFLVAALTVGSWTARNYAAFGAFIPVATTSGYNLLAGNAPDARYDTSLDVRFPEHVYTAITGKSELERDRIMQAAALEEMARDPMRTITLTAAKFLHWFDYSNTLMSDDVLESGASAVRVSTREVILLTSYLAVIALPLVARLALLRHFPFTPFERLALALWIAAGLFYAFYFTRVRFRMPYDVLVIASNAIFLAAVIERFVRRRDGLTAPR